EHRPHARRGRPAVLGDPRAHSPDRGQGAAQAQAPQPQPHAAELPRPGLTGNGPGTGPFLQGTRCAIVRWPSCNFRGRRIVATNGALYGIIAALGVVAVGGGVYIAKQEGAFGPPDTTTALTTPAPAPTPAPPPPAPVAKPPVIAAPAPPPAPPSGAAAAQAEQVHVLVLDARRAIARGEFNI